jgi:L-alanine-DL-glutamate epimerase-like enolase superfamily enzyme
MAKPTDIRCVGAKLYFLPIETRVPLKFGAATVTSVTCARCELIVRDRDGRTASGWGETPLSVTWVWPSSVSYEERHLAVKEFCLRLAKAWAQFDTFGHPLEVGWDFQEQVLPRLLREFNGDECAGAERMPWLAALVCCSLFDIALHDAYGNLHGQPIYSTYNESFISRPLNDFLQAEQGSSVSFAKKYPADFLQAQPVMDLRAWHLVGGLDPIDASELTGNEPNDGYPVLLEDWIQRDGLKCLKIKLRGTDAEWDYQRLVKVGLIATGRGEGRLAASSVEALTADFNCTVHDPAYVTEILDRLKREQPCISDLLLYVEQPFPYELEEHRIDVHSVSQRKPLFLDESAHDWRLVRLGKQLGWTGVALKTCKTQTGALLSACWAKAHGMQLMVQDLTNPMLAQIPHVLLAAHVGTIMGVETNAMQFYPEASAAEAKVHPGLYRRRNGIVNWSTVKGSGFGYRLREIERILPAPAVEAG